MGLGENITQLAGGSFGEVLKREREQKQNVKVRSGKNKRKKMFRGVLDQCVEAMKEPRGPKSERRRRRRRVQLAFTKEDQSLQFQYNKTGKWISVPRRSQIKHHFKSGCITVNDNGRKKT